jgi:hypothetical protein
MADEYVDKYLKALKESKSKKEKESVINKIYEDGFEDGVNEG